MLFPGGIMLTVSVIEDYKQGEILRLFLKISSFIVASLIPFFSFSIGEKSEILAVEKVKTSFIKWSESMKFRSWWLDNGIKDKKGYIQLTGYTNYDERLGNFLGDKIKCSRYFSTAIYKGEDIFVKGIDIKKIKIINQIKDINYYILDARKNFADLTDKCLERHNEMFILLIATDKHLVELSLDSLEKVESLLMIVKEDLEQTILLKENELSRINSDEDKLINERLDKEIFISKQLKEKRIELFSQYNNSN
jgi:hypothetical protein